MFSGKAGVKVQVEDPAGSVWMGFSGLPKRKNNHASGKDLGRLYQIILEGQ